MRIPEIPLDLDTWVTADHHFGHFNIVSFCDRPENNFTLMGDLWQELVAPDDTVLHLGDVAYRANWDEMGPMLAGLPGRKFLIRGNHDRQRPSFYERCGFTLVDPFLWCQGRKRPLVYFSHRPDTRMLHWDVNVHGHIHNNGYPPEIDNYDHRYRNVSVEETGYAPVRLREVLA